MHVYVHVCIYSHVHFLPPFLFARSTQVLHKNGAVEFSVTSNASVTVSPEYVGSRLLLKLKEMAEKFLGMPVTNAVISVPAEFDLKQRNSTVEAAGLAGTAALPESHCCRTALRSRVLYSEMCPFANHRAGHTNCVAGKVDSAASLQTASTKFWRGVHCVYHDNSPPGT